MPFPLNAYNTTNAFQDAGTAAFVPPKRSATLVVTGNQAIYQLAAAFDRNTTNLNWGPEVQVPPGRYVFDSDDVADSGGVALSGLRVRSAIAGLSAVVYIQ